MLISELSFCSGLNIGSFFIIFTFLLLFLVAKGDARRLGLNVDLVNNVGVDFGYSSTCFCRHWLSLGAQPTGTVRGILMRAGLISPPSTVVMGQKKGPP
ncbi:hypothetical protein DKX38_029782 [Salix brachista]|uniref:Uncharacterized protein n=1 Tax=Salix brachista TaxID=2182728 RepID=A0A5N5J4B5_9ROSI|nr:hypothetical protein DKX38_029782 [Salix brachista]